MVNEVFPPSKAICGQASLVIRMEPATGIAALLLVSGQWRQRIRSIRNMFLGNRTGHCPKNFFRSLLDWFTGLGTLRNNASFFRNVHYGFHITKVHFLPQQFIEP